MNRRSPDSQKMCTRSRFAMIQLLGQNIDRENLWRETASLLNLYCDAIAIFWIYPWTRQLVRICKHLIQLNR